MCYANYEAKMLNMPYKQNFHSTFTIFASAFLIYDFICCSRLTASYTSLTSHIPNSNPR
ncbi:hypothetical protein SLEP1_g8423 [Rubroshorea leprosula]|uniref:Uncharacterized protein n=1 Tax=Rubroshorea leprosula TaxID=152421 RepID=A0AAV5ICK1_9ROSI|nr:hypothetical protein SLEP1_g8423 [Rubroshorea leprosula]